MRWIVLLGLLLGLAGCGQPEAPAAGEPTAAAAVSPTAALTPTAEPTESMTETPMPSETPEPSETPAPQSAAQPTAQAGLPPAPSNLPALVPTPEPAIVGEVPPDLLQAMIDDLVARTGAGAADISVIQAEAVEWSDGSLGCPRPGEAYLQVIISGYKVVLGLGDATYDYHADDRGRFILCQ